MNAFIDGAMTMAFLANALFFRRAWAKSRDSFFALFSAAFALMALERIPLAFVSAGQHERSFIFLIRLLAFVLIIVAIVRKNSLTEGTRRGVAASSLGLRRAHGAALRWREH